MRSLASVCLLLLAGPGFAAEDSRPLPAEQIEFFEAKIRPVLIAHCYQCHSAEGDGIKGGLRLDFADGWRVGGDSGPAVLPGKPEESLLLEAIKYEGYEMPPAGQLPAHVIQDFETWVKMGAPDPRSEAPGDDLGPRVVDIEAGRQFWSFRPLAQVDVPAVDNHDWPRTDIDRFVLAAAGGGPDAC
ncbi:MAG: c-type cytochrome domain-containing protein [Planctomycetaceae bacterium]